MNSKDTSAWEWGQDPLWPNPWDFSAVRPIPRSAVAITGAHFSQKMQRHVEHESMAEKRVFKVLDAIPEVWCYLPQPLRIPLSIIGGGGYVPDVAAIFRPPHDSSLRVKPLLLEVKPRALIRSWCEENRGRVFSAIEFAHLHGWEYFIVPSPNSLAEQNHLADWVEKKSHSTVNVDLPLWGHIVEWLRNWNGIPAEMFFRRFRSSGIQDMEIIKTLNSMIFEGVLEPARDAYRNQILSVSRVPHQHIGLGDVS